MFRTMSFCNNQQMKEEKIFNKLSHPMLTFESFDTTNKNSMKIKMRMKIKKGCSGRQFRSLLQSIFSPRNFRNNTRGKKLFPLFARGVLSESRASISCIFIFPKITCQHVLNREESWGEGEIKKKKNYFLILSSSRRAVDIYIYWIEKAH